MQHDIDHPRSNKAARLRLFKQTPSAKPDDFGMQGVVALGKPNSLQNFTFAAYICDADD